MSKRFLSLLFGLALASLLFAACSRTRPMPESAKVAAQTPRGSALPPTALPMPPIASSYNKDADSSLSQRINASPLGWTLLDGRRARAVDYHGKVLVLDFWATYCPPCREQTPHLIALQRRYGAQGLQIVGLNVGGEDDRPKVAGFVEEFGIQYPLGYPDDAMAQLLFSDNNAIPQTYVFDRTGRLAKRFIGYDRTMPAELVQVIEGALAAAPASE